MSAARPTHADLRELRRQHARIRQRGEQLLDALTAAQGAFRPAPGRWTIAENLAHLNLEGAEQLAVVRRLVDRGRVEGTTGDGPFVYGGWGEWLVRSMEPPARARLHSLPRHTPPRDPSAAVEGARFLAMKDALLATLDAAEGLDLARLRAPLPWLPSWTPSLALGQWIALVAAHERRHLWQIENVQFHPAYPEEAVAGVYAGMAA